MGRDEGEDDVETGFPGPVGPTGPLDAIVDPGAAAAHFRGGGGLRADHRRRAAARAAAARHRPLAPPRSGRTDRLRPSQKSTRLNSSHTIISYAVFCLKKKKVQSTIASLATRRDALPSPPSSHN